MAPVDLVRRSVHVAARAGDGLERHWRPALSRFHEQDVVEDHRLSLRQAGTPLLPRQPFLREKDFLEPRKRVGAGWTRSRAAGDARRLSSPAAPREPLS